MCQREEKWYGLKSGEKWKNKNKNKKKRKTKKSEGKLEGISGASRGGVASGIMQGSLLTAMLPGRQLQRDEPEGSPLSETGHSCSAIPTAFSSNTRKSEDDMLSTPPARNDSNASLFCFSL